MPELGRLRRAGTVLTALVLVALAWILWPEIQHNWDAIAGFQLVFSWHQVAAALAVAVASFAVETLTWQHALNGHLQRPALRFAESLAAFNTSAVLKYLPGRVWTYGAQLVWLGRRGIPASLIVYTNLVCLGCSALIATLLGGVYGIRYFAPPGWAWALWIALVAVHAGALLFGPRLVVVPTWLARRVAGLEIAITPSPPRLMAELGAMTAVAWALMGVSCYWCGLGVGLALNPSDVVTITASMSVAWLIGYLSALTPGGLGVREGLMFFMLNQVSSPQVALVLPLVSRLLFLASELLLGAIGFAVGWRLQLFLRPDTEGS